MSLVGLHSMAPTDHHSLNLKHEASPHSVSTISSPAGTNFSPPHIQGSTNAAGSGNSNNSGGYHLNGVSPQEGATASGCYNSGSMIGPNHPAATTSAPTPSTSSDMPFLNKEGDEFDSIHLHPMDFNYQVPCSMPGTSYSISPSKMHGNPHHMIPPNSIHNPNHHYNAASPTVVVRNPFDDDEPVRSPHSAPPIPQNVQLNKFDQIRTFCPEMLIFDPNNLKRNSEITAQEFMRQGKRIPYAWSSSRLPVPYPGMDMNMMRKDMPSFLYHPPMMNPMMHPRFPPGMFTNGIPGQPVPPQPPPPPAPSKRSKKSKSAANSTAAAAASAAAANIPNFASPDPMRPPSSTNMPQQEVFKVPTLKSPTEMKQRLQTPPIGNPNKSRSPQNRKTPQCSNGYPDRRVIMGICPRCNNEFSPNNYGICCTGFGQGCGQSYHENCSELSQPAFEMILSDPRFEWICSPCTNSKQMPCLTAYK